MNTPETALPEPGKRIEVVDMLRGYAIMSIMLLHNMEHFDFVTFPDVPAWIASIDHVLWSFTDLFFAGKSYAIFALLFGFTFYIMDRNQTRKGQDFRLRFLWRMFLLLLFGVVNSLFYEGDILTMYALLGFVLVLVARLSDRWVLGLSLVLLAQPLWWADVAGQLLHPVTVMPELHRSFHYFDLAAVYQGGDSFVELIKGNLINGHVGVYLWSWEMGRFFQAPGLFMLGFWFGRKKLFEESEERIRVWKTIFFSSLLFVVLFLILNPRLNQLISDEVLRAYVYRIARSWSNLVLMLTLVSGIVLAYRALFFRRMVRGLVPFGRMSLTNYIVQSILGACIYYGFGLGLYKYVSAFGSILIGISLFLLQAWFCKWWLNHHRQGPLEALWHRGTYWNFRFKRNKS